jgi:lipopolysaccharide biosynthesis glycosyltransferase
MALLRNFFKQRFSHGHRNKRTLRWFLALRENPLSLEYHAQLVRVAVYSAQKNTHLIPHFLYDGGENHLTEWLESQGVAIIRCRTRLDDALQQLDDEMARDIARGAFLRLEIPRVMREHAWEDPFVFYTDCDVLFLKEVVSELLSIRPTKFAVAPQTGRNDFVKMNAGVMLMNIRGMSEDEDEFVDYCRANMLKLRESAWDQGAYREFYAGKWDKLPPEFNWKPYWGDSSKARIVHFHGPKPFQANLANDERATDLVARLASGDYQKLSSLWKSVLAETGWRDSF